ncbi:hypothetical protein EMIT0196MI5_80053 [Pseudomonas sp. IT-196MI5]|uniref:hypothetical protein n=1 Tax=Pseudomonas sp. IT-196MI5 TaxID=3026440 RepID=UPI0039E0E6DE
MARERPGFKAPAFSLVVGNLSGVNLVSFAGKRRILDIFPSVEIQPASHRRAS